MKPSQEALKAYVITKLAEVSFAGLEPPDAIKKIISDFAASDLPVVLGDLGNTLANQFFASKAAELSRDVAQRGAKTVFLDVIGKISMQHQRGVERIRRKSKGV